MVDPDGMDAEFIRESTQVFWGGSGVRLSDRWSRDAPPDDYFDSRSGEYLGSDGKNRGNEQIRFIDRSKFKSIENKYGFKGSTTNEVISNDLQNNSVPSSSETINEAIKLNVVRYYFARVNDDEINLYNIVDIKFTPTGTFTTLDPITKKITIYIENYNNEGLGLVYNLMSTLVHERQHAKDKYHKRPFFPDDIYIYARIDPAWEYSATQKQINHWTFRHVTSIHKSDILQYYEYSKNHLRLHPHNY